MAKTEEMTLTAYTNYGLVALLRTYQKIGCKVLVPPGGAEGRHEQMDGDNQRARPGLT
jgi:hypothetical protein